MKKSAGDNRIMKLNRRTVFAALASLSGITSVASFAPAQAAGMDPESARMEDDCMWEAVARNGSLHIIADGSGSPYMMDDDRCTPMREDPTLRALVAQAVEDGRLTIHETAEGRPILWNVTLKGRLYACEKTLSSRAQVQALRQLARRWGWTQTRQPINARVARLILRQAGFVDASFGSREPFIHDEYAGALQAGLAYPTYVVADQQGAYMTLTPTPAARLMAIGPKGGKGPDQVWIVRPNRARIHRAVDPSAWGATPTAPVRA